MPTAYAGARSRETTQFQDFLEARNKKCVSFRRSQGMSKDKHNRGDNVKFKREDIRPRDSRPLYSTTGVNADSLSHHMDLSTSAVKSTRGMAESGSVRKTTPRSLVEVDSSVDCCRQDQWESRDGDSGALTRKQTGVKPAWLS